jgi:dipeptidyl-peptidase-4
VQISDAFTLGWGAYLTTNRSIIYGLIDGRGSGLKGDKLKFSVYRHLGTVEIFDQIEVTA